MQSANVFCRNGWCRKAKSTSKVALGLITALATAAHAADLPGIKSGAENAVPACATPGRLQAYLEERNPALDKRFRTIAIEYVRQGDALGLRWDFAFFQMMRETGALTYKRDARFGTEPDRNNFAGLRPVDKTTYERFPDVATGVRAHLEHLMFYAGDRVADPASQRTQRQQATDVLGEWRKGLHHAVTFTDLAAKWTDGSDTYAKTLEKLARGFADGACKQDDPHPEFMAQARPQAAAQALAAASATEKVDGAALAKRALAESSANDTARSGLGAGAEATAAQATAGSTGGTKSQALRLINPPVADAQQTDTEAAPARKTPRTRMAAIGAAPKALTAHPPAAVPEAPLAAPSAVGAPEASTQGPKCRVWTASYGGRHAVIVKAIVDKVANFTVLDVNEGQESREADAFIAAYAKGGAVAGQFPTQNQALEKAFEMCPEG